VQKLIYGIGAFVALLIIIGFALPRTHQVEATIEIDAHPATVFALVNDFRRFSLWSPWVHTDPNARFLYSGVNRGEGAIMTWDGAIIGNGNRVITESRPYEYVEIAMSPGEPGEARSWFQLTPGVGTTIITWGFEADYGLNIVGRYFASMLGGVVARVVEADDIAYLSATSRPEPAAIADAMGKAYFQILNFIDKNGLVDAGAPLSITRDFSGSVLAFDAAIPVRGLSDSTPRNTTGVKIGQTYAGQVIRVRHVGSYRLLATTHRKISAYLAALGIRRNGAAWESYVSDPGKVPENELLTYVYYPIRAD